jgi:hypothetical protein
MIIAQLTQANAALAARLPELEPPSEAREYAVAPTPQPGRDARHRSKRLRSPQKPRRASWSKPVWVRAPSGAMAEAAESPWWRRVFGEATPIAHKGYSKLGVRRLSA